MMKMLFVSAIAVVGFYSAMPIETATAASPGCSVNWVNGDCGTTTNNGSDGSTLLGHRRVLECPKKSDDCECEHKS